MKAVIFLASLILIIGFASASGENLIEPSGFGYDNLDGPTLVPSINYSELPTVNSSEWWNTVTLGPMDDANSAQFDNIGGTLTIDESHFDLLYCQLTGCTMSGDINMNGNNIINFENLNGTGDINIIGSGTDQEVNIQSTNPFGVTSVDLLNSAGNEVSLAKIGPNIPTIFSNGYGFGGNASGVISRDTTDNANLILASAGNNSVIFGNTPDGDTQNITFGMAYDPTELGLTFLGNKLIRPVPVNGGFGLLFENRDNLTAGGFPFIYVSNTSDGSQVVTSWQQVGRNNSVSSVMNSFGPMPKSWTTFEGNGDISGVEFLYNISDYLQYCDYLQTNLSLVPEGCKYYADTTNRLVPLLFGGDLEVHRSAVIHEGLTVYDDFDYVTRDDNDFDISGGDGHIRKTQRILSNVSFIDQSLCDFNDGDLCGFINTGTPVDLVNQWNSKSSALCPISAPSDEDCAGANGAIRIMEFSEGTQFSNYTNISFYYTTAFSGVGSELSVTLDDNEGNTTTVFSQAVGLTDQFTTFIMPATYLNKSNVTTSFICNAKNNLNGCYVDDVRVFATFSEPIIINATEEQGKWVFGEQGSLDEASINVFWEIIENTTQIQKVMEIGGVDVLLRFLGNATFVDTTIENQTVIGNSNISGNLYVGGNITQNGLLLDDTYFKLNGDSVMTGNTNSSNYNATYSYIYGNGSQLTGLPETDLTGYAKYQFENNNFNGSGDITTTGDLDVGGSAQLGDANTDIHGINTAPVANQMMTEAFSSSAVNGDIIYLSRSTLTRTGTTFGGNQETSYGSYLEIDNQLDGSSQGESIFDYIAYNFINYVGDDSTIGGDFQQMGTYNLLNGDILGSGGFKQKIGFNSRIRGTAAISTAFYGDASGGNENWAFYANGGNSFLGKDNVKTYFGTGKDAYTEYDGTNWIFNPKAVGSGQMKVLGDLNVTGNIITENLTAQYGNFTNDLNVDGLYYGNGSQLTGLPETDLTGYAKYQFEDNNFNGSGNITTIGNLDIGNIFTIDSTNTRMGFNAEPSATYGINFLTADGAAGIDGEGIQMISGSGADSTSGYFSVADDGGAFVLKSGSGGDASGGSNNYGGFGADFFMSGGDGGDAAAASSDQVGGTGGDAWFTGGAGGAPNGRGGSAIIEGGSGDIGGLINLVGGVGTTTNGNINLKTGDASATVLRVLADASGVEISGSIFQDDNDAHIFGTDQDASIYWLNNLIINPQLLTPGTQLQVLGDLNVTENVIAEDRYYLGNNASIGYNATCEMIFYNSTGGVLSTIGCS